MVLYPGRGRAYNAAMMHIVAIIIRITGPAL